MMPCRETRGVERKARLPRERAAEGFAPGEHRSVFRAETERLAKLFKMSRMKPAPVEQRLDVAGQEGGLLIRRLRRARQRRGRVLVVCDVAEREDVLVPTQLQRRLDEHQSAFIFLHVQLFNERMAATPRSPAPARRFH